MGVQLSNTTDQSGHVQRVERWTRRPYGSSGDELREIINDLNEAETFVAFQMLKKGKYLSWDDNKHTDKPTGTFNITQNVNNYKITTDENGNDIYDILYVETINETGDTNYEPLKRITADDPRVPEFLNPDTARTGQPREYLQLGNRIFFDILPEADVTSGGRIGFKREPNRFTVTGTSGDDTTESSLPAEARPLIHWIAALWWNEINRSDETSLLNRLERRINQKYEELGIVVENRNPTRVQITTKKVRYI